MVGKRALFIAIFFLALSLAAIKFILFTKQKEDNKNSDVRNGSELDETENKKEVR